MRIILFIFLFSCNDSITITIDASIPAIPSSTPDVKIETCEESEISKYIKCEETKCSIENK